MRSSIDPQQIEEAYARPRRGGNLPAMRLEASSILAKAHQGIDAVAERKAEAAARLKSLGQLIDPYLLVRATGDPSWRKMRPKSASSATRYLSKSWAPLHGVPIEQITRQQLKARRDEFVTSFESTVAELTGGDHAL